MSRRAIIGMFAFGAFFWSVGWVAQGWSETVTEPSLACTPTLGIRTLDGTTSWSPSCSGSYVGQAPTAFSDPSPTGQAYNAEGTIDTLRTTTAQVFINAITRPSQVGQNGLFLAFDSGEGASADAPVPNNSGLLVVSRQHPRRGGGAAPPTWTVNTNTLCAPGSKGSICLGYEQDYTNFDRPCAHVSDGCGIHAANWHNYQTAFPIAQDTYISANTGWQSAKVSVAGNKIKVLSGAPFSSDATTIYIGQTVIEQGTSTGVPPKGGGIRYRISPGSYNASDSSVLLTSVPTQQGTTFSAWNPHAVADVFLLSGDTVAADNDIHDTTSAYNAIKFGGFHQVLVDASADKAPIFAALSSEQAICFDGIKSCLRSIKSSLVYEAQFASKSFHEELSTPKSSHQACRPGDFTDDASYHYVCVSTDKWRRVALADF